MSDIETATVETDERQLDFFTKSHGEEMTMAEFSSWIGQNYGGMGVMQALQQAAFMLGCDVIAQDIAKSTLRLRERLMNGTSRVVHPEQHEIAALLATEPNRRHTWYEFNEMMVLWRCLTSNAYAGVLRNNTDDPLELIPFQTGRVRDKIEGRDVFYDVTAGTMQEQALLGSVSRTFHERDMIHVRGRMLDGMEGYSTLSAGKTTLETGAAIEDYRGHLFSEEGQMRGVFTRKGVEPLPEPQFQRIRQQYKILMNKFRQLTEPIILEGDVEFKSISSKPDEIELTKQVSAQINATCRLLRVPPYKVFQMDGVKYDNLETGEKMYVGDTLIPVAKPFEQRYGKILLSKKDRLRYFLEYDRSEMTLRDPKNEAERVIKSSERGLITADEARAVLGYNPLPNKQGETRTIPVNMTVVDADGKVLIGGKAVEPDKNKPADDASAEDDAKSKTALRLVTNN
ncbi:phage portal protein [Mesorhizobium sp. M0189]|uniref:phage portal protein n=1 Tax=Mesorhizobium sp. M0189 TaxID=2956909 RepID=UPI003335DD10